MSKGRALSAGEVYGNFIWWERHFDNEFLGIASGMDVWQIGGLIFDPKIGTKEGVHDKSLDHLKKNLFFLFGDVEKKMELKGPKLHTPR